MGIDDLTQEDWDLMRKNQEYQSALDKHLESKILEAELKASSTQVGGSHYKKFPIQPAEFCHVNKIPYLEATAIKYLCRWRDKGGFEDLNKAKHFIDLIMEYENAHK